MALKWYENMGTQLNSKAWSESVEQAKVTNVLGLAWNYYWAYTKFITGADVTLDMGLKAEFFMADTYKIGYAGATDIGNVKMANIKKAYLAYMETKDEIVNAQQNVVEQRVASISDSSEDFGVRNSQVGDDSIVRESLESSTTGAEVRESGSLSLSVAADMELEGPSILLYGEVNINDVFEVLG